jgi:hypothetical protein
VPSQDHDFDPPILAARIVQGAVEGDAVRLHGAIEAALQLYPATASDIFELALRTAAATHGDEYVNAINDAVQFHVAGQPIARMRHCPHCGAGTVQEHRPLGASGFVWVCTVCGLRTQPPSGPSRHLAGNGWGISILTWAA